MDEPEHHVRPLPADHLVLRELGHEGRRPARPEELQLLEPFRGKVPDEVFGEPYVPPVSDGSGSDRNLLRRADALLREAGCKRDGTVLKLPNGKPFEIEFLDYQATLQPHTQPFQANLKRLGIEARSRIVDAAQYQRRMDEFDFDMALDGARRGDDAGRRAARRVRLQAARRRARATSPASPIRRSTRSSARSRKPTRATKLNVACRALDRVLRAGRYMDPDVVPRRRLGRLLGHVLAARDEAEIRLRRARHLVVRRREGESDREGVIVKAPPTEVAHRGRTGIPPHPAGEGALFALRRLVLGWGARCPRADLSFADAARARAWLQPVHSCPPAFWDWDGLEPTPSALAASGRHIGFDRLLGRPKYARLCHTISAGGRVA